MKKSVSLLLLLAMLLSVCSVASAETAPAQKVKPVMPERLRELVAGKTFTARWDGYACDEEIENVTLYFQVCEQETYTAEEVEALQAGDVIVIGGDEFVVKAIEQDEFGYNVTGLWYSIFLYKGDNGLYKAVTDTENRFYTNLFAFEVPAPTDLRFLNWSDPEAEAPVEMTLKDLVTMRMNDEIFSSEDNTEITFDENGRLIEIVYRYTPWN